MVRLPANYTFPNHSHTSDELYVWLKGNFTVYCSRRHRHSLSGQSYISLPGGVPHALPVGRNRACSTCAMRDLSTCTCTPCPRTRNK